MKIIYKKPILEQIHAAILEAKKSGKEIDHLHLSEKEFYEIRRAVHLASPSVLPITGGIIMGVRFVVEKDEDLGKEDPLAQGGEIDLIIKDIMKHVFGIDPKHVVKA